MTRSSSRPTTSHCRCPHFWWTGSTCQLTGNRRDWINRPTYSTVARSSSVVASSTKTRCRSRQKRRKWPMRWVHSGSTMSCWLARKRDRRRSMLGVLAALMPPSASATRGRRVVPPSTTPRTHQASALLRCPCSSGTNSRTWLDHWRHRPSDAFIEESGPFHDDVLEYVHGTRNASSWRNQLSVLVVKKVSGRETGLVGCGLGDFNLSGVQLAVRQVVHAPARDLSPALSRAGLTGCWCVGQRTTATSLQVVVTSSLHYDALHHMGGSGPVSTALHGAPCGSNIHHLIN